MLTLISELVTTIVDPRYPWHLSPIEPQIIHDYLSASNGQTPTKMLILLYLLTLNDQATGQMNDRFDQSARRLFDLLPLPQLVEQLTSKDYDAIASPLGRSVFEKETG